MNAAIEEETASESFSAIGLKISTLLPTMSVLNDVAMGWTDSLMFDSQFIEPKLKQGAANRKTNSLDNVENSKPLSQASAADLLNSLDFSASVQELDESIHALNEMREAVLLRDDYWEFPPDVLSDQLQQSFSGDRFNLLIVGAGPVGALLASGLKRELGDAINVLLVESRVSKEHYKLAYSRRWLANIPMKLFERLVHPIAAKACALTGDGTYMGVDICSLETLALLSAREAGVRCLFSAEDHLKWIAESPLHLLVDASGARWQKKIKSDEKIFKGVRLNDSVDRANGYLSFGLVRAKKIPGNKIDVLQKDGWLYPLYKAKPVKQSLLKISDVPLDIYPTLLQWVQANNQDSKFYIWPGKKRSGINRILVLVNLSAKEHDAMSKQLQADSPLLTLMKWSGFKSMLDPRLQELFRRIYAHEGVDHVVSVSKPFIYAPRMLDPESSIDQVAGKPLLPIGDSFFCGNPKSGNGLGVHLKHIQLIGHHLTAALKSKQAS